MNSVLYILPLPTFPAMIVLQTSNPDAQWTKAKSMSWIFHVIPVSGSSRMSGLIAEACLCAAPRPLTQCSVLICCLAPARTESSPPSCTGAIHTHRYKLETDGWTDWLCVSLSSALFLLSSAQLFSPLVSFICCLLGWLCYRSRPPVVWACDLSTELQHSQNKDKKRARYMKGYTTNWKFT